MDNLQGFSCALLAQLGNLSKEEHEWVFQCRRNANRLGFCYQLIFVKIFNRFPSPKPLEIIQELLDYASVQIQVPVSYIQEYQKRRQTLYEHQQRLLILLQLKRYDENISIKVENFIAEEAMRFEKHTILFNRTQNFLKENRILQPGEITLKRLVASQKEKASQSIFLKVKNLISPKEQSILDQLLISPPKGNSSFQRLKLPASAPSANGLIALGEKIELILSTGIQNWDLSWLHSNYQRHMARYAYHCSAARITALAPDHRFTVLACFLQHTYQETLDQIIDMFFKLMTRITNHINKQIQDRLQIKRKVIKETLFLFQTLGHIILDETIPETDLKKALFKKIEKENLKRALDQAEPFLVDDQQSAFSLLLQKFSYLRRFSPLLLNVLPLETKTPKHQKLIQAVHILKELNDGRKRKLAPDTPIDFVPKTLQNSVKNSNSIQKRAYECAILLQLRKEVKAGNITVKGSKRFCDLEMFFMPYPLWEKECEFFFRKSNLPHNPLEAELYLKERLKKSYTFFLDKINDNSFARIEEGKLVLSTDEGDCLTSHEVHALEKLKDWLSSSMRSIKLPDLLIEVDNGLQFTRAFMHSNKERQPEDVCAVLAALMAHGCFIGTYTMSRMTNISYDVLRKITDWQLTEEGHRLALACLVNSISNLDITTNWGRGLTSSSDGQRFSFTRNSLSKTFSHCFSDYALEFYTFVADNYAPFWSKPIECTDRDAPHALDGIMYNESDLRLEEHYTDSHGYTDINFTAFAMVGKKFSPRIKGVHHQRLYRLEDQTEKDCGPLWPLVSQKKHVIQFEPIIEQWNRMGHFYASLQKGHVTASTALKRLISFPENNQFCKANRELGRLLKTESILEYLSDPNFRKRQRRGLLKGEQIHQLARHVAYGKRGKINARDFYEQKNTCSSLTLIMACIIYWQAKEIKRLIEERGNELEPLCLEMLPHISPIGWDNVILYGEYVLNKWLVR